MKLYNFSQLITKYLVPCQLVVMGSGRYDPDKGKWIEPEEMPPVDMKLVIIPVEQRTLFESGGKYTAADRMIISRELLPAQSRVIFKGKSYRVEDFTDYDIYADFNVYIGKWVEPVA